MLPILIAGATATGKSEIAVRIAETAKGEVIGADARQIHSGLEVLTAAADEVTKARVPHHLVGSLDRGIPFSAADYRTVATGLIAEILNREKTPVVVGGTGLYLKALTHGLVPSPAGSDEIRKELAGRSLEDLVQRLQKEGPGWLAVVDLKNRRRVERALERVLQGQIRPPAQTWDELPSQSEFAAFLLVRDRGVLHERINQRTVEMFKRGAVEQVREMVGKPSEPEPIGFQQIRSLLDGETTEAVCISLVQAATRQYAKRQMTWFKKESIFQIVNLDDQERTMIDTAEWIIEKAKGMTESKQWGAEADGKNS